MCRQSQLLYTVFAGSNDLNAPGLPHLVLRKMVHERYHTNTAGAPVNDIAVFRVRKYDVCIDINIIIILCNNCRLSLPVCRLVLSHQCRPVNRTTRGGVGAGK
jgi:hypothetical protein